MKKEVVVLGASTNKERYSNKLIHQLIANGFSPIPVGRRKGEIAGITILTELPEGKDFYAISLYLNANNQADYVEFILESNTEKVIFNPGSENPDLMKRLAQKDKFAEEACSLVQMSLGIF